MYSNISPFPPQTITQTSLSTNGNGIILEICYQLASRKWEFKNGKWKFEICKTKIENSRNEIEEKEKESQDPRTQSWHLKGSSYYCIIYD